ncbi:hypothetical protein [Brevibacterium sp. ZH18]|uniref:hypothetical protein n=1 Tax=Brevibacterium sp. ZH18 TaxID=2927784 RepID=UPI001F616813|nr:hypothetical protein [Brevibacterium sp. ZH18]MCI4010230.1 hypothetical protein [Brevibacterium sp. ZH18]
MVSRTTVMTLPLALALVLAGCSGPADEASPKTSAADQSQAAEASASPEASGGTASTQPTKDSASTNVKDLPDYIKPYPDSEVLSSSASKAKSGDNELKQVSLVVKAKAKPKDIFKFYDKALKKGGFESYGKEVKTKSAEVVNYRNKDNDGLLVVTIAKDPSDTVNSIVTVGGNVIP